MRRAKTGTGRGPRPRRQRPSLPLLLEPVEGGRRSPSPCSPPGLLLPRRRSQLLLQPLLPLALRECRRTGGPLPGPGRSGGPGGPRGCVFGFSFYFIFQGLERGGERKKRRSERASACDVLLLTRFHPRPAGFNCACFPPRDRVQRPSSLHSMGMRESESRTVVSQGSRRSGENRVACGSTLRERGCEGKKRASKHEQHRPEARWISPSPHSRLQPPCRPGVSVETVILHCRKGSESD